MEGFGRVQEEAWGAGGRKGRDHFLPDQAGFTHATDHGASLATEDQFNSLLEFAIQAVSQLGNRLGLSDKGFFSNCKVVHFLTFVPEKQHGFEGGILRILQHLEKCIYTCVGNLNSLMCALPHSAAPLGKLFVVPVRCMAQHIVTKTATNRTNGSCLS
ncbi:hypothetical protein D3C77_425100 [compost metagenome]